MQRRVLLMIGICASNAVSAGSFSLYTESNGYSIGNFGAGVAAEAYDASTGWYNPAGLALIHKQQVIVAGVGVLPSSTLSGTTQYTTFVTPTFSVSYPQSFNNLQGAENGYVPSVYYAKPLGSNATFGLSINAPFGLSSNWGQTSPLRYSATSSELQTIDISPELGGKISEHFALGAGIDLQYARVKFNSVLGAPALLAELSQNPMAWDSSSNNTGQSFGGGVHVGLMGMWNEDHTRVGLNYQSRVSHQFNGTSKLTGPLADPQTLFTDPNYNAVYSSNSLQSNAIQLPDIVTLSGYHDLNEKWALLGSVVFTGWGTFKNIALDNVAGFDPAAFNNSLVDFVSTENYRNAWRGALGANYHINDRWMLRFGGGYDQTPTVNAYRDARIPDADRWAISVGAHYQPHPRIVIDAGYTYLQAINGTGIDKTIALGDANEFTVVANGKAYVNVVGAQIRWMIDKVV